VALTVKVERLLAEFTAALRELRQRAGNPTFRTMSRRTSASATTLYRVEIGKQIPTQEAVLAYVRACDGDQDLWRHQHRELRAAARTGAKSKFVPWRNYFNAESGTEREVPPPSAATLRTEMRRLRFDSGLTLHEIAERTASPDIAPLVGKWGLGVSTISDLCNPQRTHVPRRRTLHGFLLAVDADRPTIDKWLYTRNHLAAQQDQRPASSSHSATVQRDIQVRTGPPNMIRFKQLRRALSEEVFSTRARLIEVLQGIGVDVKTALALSRQPRVARAFLQNVDHEMHTTMMENPLLNRAEPQVMELAVYRTLAELQPQIELLKDRKPPVYRPPGQGV
jgi:hypothetical protein